MANLNTRTPPSVPIILGFIGQAVTAETLVGSVSGVLRDADGTGILLETVPGSFTFVGYSAITGNLALAGISIGEAIQGGAVPGAVLFVGGTPGAPVLAQDPASLGYDPVKKRLRSPEMLAQGFLVADQGGVLHLQTVTPSGGDDFPGLAAARAEIPLASRGAAYAVDLTGCIATTPQGDVWPEYTSPSGGVVGPPGSNPDFFDFFFPVHFFAKLKTSLTIGVGHILSQPQQADSQILTLHTDLALVPGALVDLVVVDSTGVVGVVSANTATDIEVTTTFPVNAGAPVFLKDYGGILNTNPGSFVPTVALYNCKAFMAFQGLKIENPDNVAALELAECSKVEAFFCSLQGVSTGPAASGGDANSQLFFESCALLGNVTIEAPDSALLFCFFDSHGAGPASAILSLSSGLVSGAVFDGITPVSFIGSMFLSQFIVRQANEGVRVSTSVGVVENAFIHDNGADGLHVDNLGVIYPGSCRIENNAGDGIVLSERSAMFLTGPLVGSANAGTGTVLIQGSSALERVPGNLAVNGNDAAHFIQIGTNPVLSQAAFAGLGDIQSDWTATGDGSNIRVN